MEQCFIDGNEAMAMGAIYAGCRFFAAYPITPAGTLFAAMLDRLPSAGGTVLQGEDEIAAIGYCLGASMAGMKVMTATSGPGISLYSENISFAVAGEIPIVIVDVMRQGPSTGAATLAADGDVQFLRWGCSGGLPVIVLAPSDVRDCFTLSVHAFNLAERFRCPVFLASNKEVGMTRETIDMEKVEKPRVIERTLHQSGPFLPFGVGEGEDVPAFLPIGGPVPVRQTSSTHGADGCLTTDSAAIQAGVERLQRKIESRREALTFFDVDRRDRGPHADRDLRGHGACGKSCGRGDPHRNRKANFGADAENPLARSGAPLVGSGGRHGPGPRGGDEPRAIRP